MIRICICDDQKEGLAILQNYGNRFRKNHPELPIQIDCFSASYDLLEAVENLGGYDIYLLDVILPDLNGIEVAHWLRDRGGRAEIVFLTTSREYAVEAFEVKAAGYLVKPIEEKDFIRELTDCIGKLTPADDPAILVKTGKLLRKVLVREIVTVESFNHNCVCILSDGTSLEATATLASLREQLDPYPSIFSPHRSYHVNFDYVSGLTISELSLTDGRRIPISRRIYAPLKAAYLDYTFSTLA